MEDTEIPVKYNTYALPRDDAPFRVTALKVRDE